MRFQRAILSRNFRRKVKNVFAFLVLTASMKAISGKNAIDKELWYKGYINTPNYLKNLNIQIGFLITIWNGNDRRAKNRNRKPFPFAQK